MVIKLNNTAVITVELLNIEGNIFAENLNFITHKCTVMGNITFLITRICKEEEKMYDK